MEDGTAASSETPTATAPRDSADSQVQTDLTAPRERSPASTAVPRRIDRSQHPISRKHMDAAALRVLERLSKMGFKAYLVGGAVRDLYLGRTPKDYDVATDAKPSRLKKIFHNCRIIGRRFRIAHVRFSDGQIVEVATFRQNSPRIVRTESGVIVRDNEFGTPQQDAVRRDLTINGLFYDIASFSIIDYVGGVNDLENGIIRTISDPDASLREDPVRMIRALRHAARTGFQVEEKTLEAIYRNSKSIVLANPARLLEELLKDLRSGAASPFFTAMVETHLLDSLCPDLAQQLRATGPDHSFWGRMKALDQRTSAGESFSNAVLLGLFLQTVLLGDDTPEASSPDHPPQSWRHVQRGFREMEKGFRVSRRDAERVSQILMGVRKLEQGWQRGRLLPSLRRKVYLLEALEFLLIDLAARGAPTDLAETWRRDLQASTSREEPPSRQQAERDDGESRARASKSRRRRRSRSRQRKRK